MAWLTQTWCSGQSQTLALENHLLLFEGKEIFFLVFYSWNCFHLSSFSSGECPSKVFCAGREDQMLNWRCFENPKPVGWSCSSFLQQGMNSRHPGWEIKEKLLPKLKKSSCLQGEGSNLSVPAHKGRQDCPKWQKQFINQESSHGQSDLWI